MSIITKQAIVAALEADTVFVQLLAADPNAQGSPALFNARMNDLTPVYDCVTFREAGTKPVRSFNPAQAGEAVNRVEQEMFDFEIWTKETSDRAIERIRLRLDAHLHQQTISLGTAGRVFWSERVVTSPDNWDPKLLARFGLFRYRLLVEYATYSARPELRTRVALSPIREAQRARQSSYGKTPPGPFRLAEGEERHLLTLD